MAYNQTTGHIAPLPYLPAPHLHMTQRITRAANLTSAEEKLLNGITPAAVAGVTAMLAQLECQQTLPSMTVSIVADVSGYKRTMTCTNCVWDGHDLTHQFLDDKSTSVYGPGNQTTTFKQEASLRMSPCVPVPQPMPPAHLVIQPQPLYLSQPPHYLPHVQQLVSKRHQAHRRHTPVLPPCERRT